MRHTCRNEEHTESTKYRWGFVMLWGGGGDGKCARGLGTQGDGDARSEGGHIAPLVHTSMYVDLTSELDS
jgi:hypothetical protein